MDIAMLVLSIISTLMAIGSFVIALCVKRETKEIKNNLSVKNFKSGNSTEIHDNSGVVADKIEGGVTLNGNK